METIKNIIKYSFILLFVIGLGQINLYSQPKKTGKTQKFSEKSYYATIFDDGERKELSEMDKTIDISVVTFEQIKQQKANSAKLLKQAERETAKRAKKKLFAEKAKLDESILKQEMDMYNRLYAAQSGKYSIYLSNIEDARYDTKVENPSEARDYEKKAKDANRDVEYYKKAALGKNSAEMLKDYMRVDSLQRVALVNFENAFMVYYGESPKGNIINQLDSEEFKKFLEEEDLKYKAEIKALLGDRPDEAWMKQIDRTYEDYEKNFKRITEEEAKIVEYEKEKIKLSAGEKNERDIASVERQIENSEKLIKRYSDDAAKIEKQIIALLANQISEDRQENKKKFESYNDGFSHCDRLKATSKVLDAEKEIVKHLTTAKDYLNKAEFSNTTARARLKIYTYLLQANFHQAEAMDKLVAIRRDSKIFFTINETKLLSDCAGNTTGVADSKNKGKGEKGTTGKTTTGTTSGTNTDDDGYVSDNKWKSPNNKGIKYKVQILAQTEVPKTADFKGMSPISSEKLENTSLTAYLVGNTASMYQAEKTLADAKKKGFKDAYIVAYDKDANRIALWKAEDIINGVSNETRKNTSYSNTSSTTDNDLAFKNFSGSKGIVYTVQVAYSNKRPQAYEVKNLTPLYEYKQKNGFAKYSIGVFNDFESADSECSKIKRLGIDDAFVVAYENGKPIDLQEALRKNK